MKLRLNRCQSFLCRLGLIKGHTAHDDIHNRSLETGHGLNRCLDSLLNRQRNLAHALAKLDQNAQLYADCILLAQLYAHALVLALLAQQACNLSRQTGSQTTDTLSLGRSQRRDGRDDILRNLDRTLSPAVTQ